MFVIHDDPANLTFTVAADDPAALKYIFKGSLPIDESIYFQRRYITSNIKQRLHQENLSRKGVGNIQPAVCVLQTETLRAY